jgi:NhaP-type Na+/H+ and K+/H+ antiporter
MNTTDNIHPSGVEIGGELIEVAGGGLRVVELGIFSLLGLLVCPPLLILAVVVAVPVIATAAVVAAVVAPVAVATWLVRRVHAHHRTHGSTVFLHRLRPS